MRIACWMPEATNTHSEYVILLYFSTETVAARARLRATICVHCLSCWMLGWVHTCNVTAYRNTVSWQCGRDSWPRNVSKFGYAVTLQAFSVRCRYLAVASKGWYGYGRSRCGRAMSRCTSTPAPAVIVSFLWCDGQIPTAHRKSP